MEEEIFYSGFVSVIGRPNAGKSTLINYILGEKVVITSDKPQTTRNKIQCVYNGENSQIIFLDTPGMHKPKHKLGEKMVKAVDESLNEMDAILFVIDVSVPFGKGETMLVERLARLSTPVILVMNKMDLVDEDLAREKTEKIKEKLSPESIHYISALYGNNLVDLLGELENLMPEGPKYYPEDQLIDQPERFVVSELIREKLLNYTQEEIPHSVAVEIMLMENREDQDLIDIEAVIYVERESQKKIVIGRRGKLLKKVGQEARRDIENLLGSQIYLDLWVKNQKDWRNRERFLRELGY
ncbi:GTPase Era [Natranaerobius thermophilus]|uniref:GTPase Era n=1 Tax=Natranaerobius thermophilus (strain ATCC BAA-1301 / DSM 18059 / JW/NM-WN-LF) TaxID=457570 RepID=B2A1Y3_NATTJ|nr:GTPase Era [Natranaerobius thermophilus]ACB84788.1 GTP-binding protein Era [Natranaerobius thermophilus JW/NM-WN-LF]